MTVTQILPIAGFICIIGFIPCCLYPFNERFSRKTKAIITKITIPTVLALLAFWVFANYKVENSKQVQTKRYEISAEDVSSNLETVELKIDGKPEKVEIDYVNKDSNTTSVEYKEKSWGPFKRTCYTLNIDLND